MALSPIEDRYLSALTEREFPTYVPEASPEVMEPMQLAAGPSQTVSDAGGGAVMKPTPRNPVMGGVADFVRGVRDLANQYEVKQFVPLLGGMGVGDLLVGKSPEELEEWAYGNAPMRVPEMTNVPMIKTGRKEQVMDTMFLGVDAAGVGKATGMAGKAAAKTLGPTAANMAGDLLQSQGLILNAVQPGPGVVSTRLPTAVKATENPMTSKLVIDLAASKSDPEAFSYNMGMIKQYPNFASKARNPDRQAEDFITSVKDNLLFLHDQVPDATRQRSKLWYDGARKITDNWSADYGVSDQAVAGVLAVLSPQKDWFMNVSLGQRVLDIMSSKQGNRWDSGMDDVAQRIWVKPQYAPMVEAIKGKTLAEISEPGLKAMWLRTYDQAYNPREHQVVTPEGDFAGVRLSGSGSPYQTGWGSLNEIGKAVVIFEDSSVENISKNLGAAHKVRNFYNNIYAPNDPAGHVTIDTHAVAAGLMRPLSGNSREVLHNFGSGVVGEGGPKSSSITGVNGTYGIYAEAYRRAAAERGILPREMQSITWEAVRGLFPDTFKTPANAAQMDGIWLKYKQGKLSLEEAQNDVIRSAGGINAPEWERAGLRPEPSQAVQPSPDAGQLSGSGLPGGSAGTVGSAERSGTTPGNPAKVNRGRPAPDQGAN